MKTEKTLTCKLTTPELQARKKTAIATLKSRVLDRVESARSVKYKFEGSDEHIDLIADFMKSERACCDFFDFQVSLNSEGFLWLKLSGPEGVVKFINQEIGF